MQRKWVINGRWLTADTTGTQRYAGEVARRLLEDSGDDITLVLPADASAPDWVPTTAVRRTSARGQVFEQLVLPFIARRHVLINLAGPAPLLARRQVVVLFDLSWKRFPDSVSRGFAAWYRLLYSTFMRRGRCQVVSISEFSRDELVSAYGPQSRAVSVAACGADHFSTVPAVRPGIADELPDEFVLCLGTLNRRKNLGAVLPLLSEAGITSVVVGTSGPARVYGEAQDSHADAYARYPGRLSDAEIAWLMDHATGLVFPSIYEGFGLPIVEAQSRGCPVICVGQGAMLEVSGGAALFIAADGAGVVDAVRRLADPQVRTQLVDAGHANVARYRWEAASDVIADQARGLARQ